MDIPVFVDIKVVRDAEREMRAASLIQEMCRGRVKMKKTEALQRLSDLETHTPAEQQKIMDAAEAAKVEAATAIAALQLKVAALQLKVKTL